MIDENMPILNLPILMLDIAEALSYIHQHDLAHRDIKSANILLTWDKELERVRAKIADFGSANAVSVVPVRKKDKSSSISFGITERILSSRFLIVDVTRNA